MFKITQETHKEKMKRLCEKKKIAEMKREERKIKREIFMLYLPFQFKFKFNKFAVTYTLVAITSYTIAAILLQKYTSVEISPTLTTCVYAFFGTELLTLASIKNSDTKASYTQRPSSDTANSEGSVG